MALSFSTGLTFIFLIAISGVTSQLKTYYMDKLSDCGRTVNVDDNGVKIHARSFNAPSNPLLRCIIYLRSSYTRNDGTNKLQIDVDQLNIRDCEIVLNLYNGRTSVGDWLRSMSCQKKPSGVIYSTTNEVTVKLTRPDTLHNTEYAFTLSIKPWKDRSVLASKEGNEKLAIGAIIGIVIGCLVLIAVLIFLCWYCCSKRGLGDRFKPSEKPPPGHLNRGLTEEKYKPPALVLNEPNAWNANSGPRNDNYNPRYFQRGVPRNDMRQASQHQYGNARQFDYDRRQTQEATYYNNRNDYRPQNRDNYENQNANVETKKPSPQQQRKETLIDDVFDSETDTQATDIDDATLRKRPISGEGNESPRSKKKNQPLPEQEDDVRHSPKLQRYKSMDLQSQPDTDTITSPVHVNAGVRASVDDELSGSPHGSLRKNKSPKSKRKSEKHPRNSVPPEASEPIFTEPISDIDYQRPAYGAQFQGGFMPYGILPPGVFAPGVPGSQTFAYAYQTPGYGYGAQPASQGAYVVQNTPTTEGNRRTAYAVEETIGGKRGKNSDLFGKPSNRESDGSRRRGHNRDKAFMPDMSVVTRGVVPPDSGQGHKSVVMKSGTDPDTGVHTVQGVWTDTTPDPTDPEPGVENPQITRKTTTRVTTKSGHGELAPNSDTFQLLEDPEPAFLAPSSRSAQAFAPSIMPSDTSNHGNLDFYAGVSSAKALPPPERSSTPTSTLRAPTYNNAIRDRILLDDSTV